MRVRDGGRVIFLLSSMQAPQFAPTPNLGLPHGREHAGGGDRRGCSARRITGAKRGRPMAVCVLQMGTTMIGAKRSSRGLILANCLLRAAFWVVDADRSCLVSVACAHAAERPAGPCLKTSTQTRKKYNVALLAWLRKPHDTATACLLFCCCPLLQRPRRNPSDLPLYYYY